MMDDPARALSALQALNSLGVRLSIDDFGTGYSSLAYIKQLPVQEIKIDRSFVMEMDSHDNDAIIVKTTINMCHDLGFDVVAEGVETAQTCEALCLMGCDYLQGYHLSRPIAFEDFVAFIKRENNLGYKRAKSE
jgi:EAL domain-containing protein (putative c-di-GMP-specific phosphodiesterase class I)